MARSGRTTPRHPLLGPIAQRRRRERAADYARDAELDLAGDRGADAAERERALAELAPPRHVAPRSRPLALELLDRGGRLLAQARRVDRLGRLDHLGQNRRDFLGLLRMRPFQ